MNTYVLRAFGFGDWFVSWVKLLYAGASIMIKVGGGLGCLVPLLRGIRQGCPLLGELYSLTIEPLLCRLRTVLNGFTITGDPDRAKCKRSAYLMM